MIDLAHLEQQKSAFLGEVAGWSPTRLAFRPDPAQWSAAQVLDHLARTETEILAAARRGLSKPHPLGLRDKLGSAFVQYVFKTNRKVKVPSSASRVLPQPDPSLPGVLAEWNALRLDLAQFIASLAPQQTTQGIFRHPVTGWMDLPRILGFFSVHITHHRFQLAHLRAASVDIDPPAIP